MVDERAGDGPDGQTDGRPDGQSHESGRRWDASVEGAWAQFRVRLADHLAALEQDDHVLVTLPGDDLEGAAAYCQVMAYGPGRLRVEAVSNAYLDPGCALDEGQERQLLDLGLSTPAVGESHNFWLDLETRDADRAAWVVVEALRRVHGVLHPVYLQAEGLEPAGAPEPTETGSGGGAEVTLEGDGPWTPRTRDDVRAMLRHCASELVEGGEAELDDDGDLTVTAGECLLWVAVASGTPRLLMSAVLAVDVVDEQRALVEVNLLNRREFGLTFLLQDGRVTVRRELPVSVFVGWEVRGEMERILDEVERWSREMVVRVGGRAPYDAGPVRLPGHERAAPSDGAAATGDRLAAALEVLHELERGDRDALTPQLLADVLLGDRELVLGAIRDARQREEDALRRARKGEKAGRTRMPRMWRAKARHHREVRVRLRQALRLVVQRTAREHVQHQEQLTLFDEDEVTR